MIKILLTYLATLLSLLLLDVIYLGGFAKDFFSSQLSPAVMLVQPVLVAALMFYLMYAVGIMIFMAVPCGRSAAFKRAAWLGAAFGLVAYGTYDLTNMATIVSWKWIIVVIDMSWGAIATAIASCIGAATYARLSR